jgi:hypothetical protein
MFKRSFFPFLIALFATILVPSVALAQLDTTYEDTTIEWDTTWDDWDYDYDYDYDYDLGDAAASAGVFAALVGIMLIPGIVIGIGSYVYSGLALSKIAKRLDHPNPWFAWVPFLNMVLVLQLADLSPWLILLALIPGVNAFALLILSVISMMKICEKRGMDKNLGLLALIPGAVLVLIGILAWKKDDGETSSTETVKEEVKVEELPEEKVEEVTEVVTEEKEEVESVE